MAIGGGGSFSSDQTTLQKDTGAISLLRAGRARVTSIQGRGGAGAGNLMATFKYDTEGLAVYVPGSGILFKDGICATLTQTTGTDGSVTLTITGA